MSPFKIFIKGETGIIDYMSYSCGIQNEIDGRFTSMEFVIIVFYKINFFKDIYIYYKLNAAVFIDMKIFKCTWEHGNKNIENIAKKNVCKVLKICVFEVTILQVTFFHLGIFQKFQSLHLKYHFRKINFRGNSYSFFIWIQHLQKQC